VDAAERFCFEDQKQKRMRGRLRMGVRGRNPILSSFLEEA